MGGISVAGDACKSVACGRVVGRGAGDRPSSLFPPASAHSPQPPTPSPGAIMAVNMNTSGVHHVSLRVSDLDRAKKFYCDTLGFKHLMDADNICLFLAGGTAFGLRGPTEEMPRNDKFNPHRIGVDHIAL